MRNRGLFVCLKKGRWPLAVLLALAAAICTAAEEPANSVQARPWVLFDGPLWDISDEGLPYRLTFAWPGRIDPLARLLRAGTARWTVGVGYATAYDNLDTGTNTITARGRDGAMFNAGRQLVWPVPLPLPRGALGLEFELGLNYAFSGMPADGTHLSFSLIGGFEWRSAKNFDHGWLAGVRWFHLSHGGLFGPNGGYDGIIFRLGRRWSW